MNRLTAKGIERYLTETYGECRHNPKAMAHAAKEVAKTLKCKPLDVFRYVIRETKDIPGLYLTSYGFQTRDGREVIHQFEYYYHGFEG
jgi:hypothetical protein